MQDPSSLFAPSLCGQETQVSEQAQHAEHDDDRRNGADDSRDDGDDDNGGIFFHVYLFHFEGNTRVATFKTA